MAVLPREEEHQAHDLQAHLITRDNVTEVHGEDVTRWLYLILHDSMG